MNTLIIQRQIEIPIIGTWKWKEEDYKTPLIFTLQDNTKAFLYLEKPWRIKEKAPILNARLEFHFEEPSALILKELRSSGVSSLMVAEKIYHYYKQIVRHFEGLIRTVGKAKSTISVKLIDFESFFAADNNVYNHSKVSWHINNTEIVHFCPKIKKERRKTNTLFKRNQLIDTNKWKKMQDAINCGNFPSDEIIELYRIWGLLEWDQRKVPTIEAAIIAETILRNYTKNVLINCGISNNKMKNLQDEFTFNSMLNIVLPLTLSKSERRKIQGHIQAIDLLRKIRNDLVHGEMTEKDIDKKKVQNGIDATLKLIKLIR